MNMRKTARFKAFTLLELVIVIAILAVMAAVIIPNTAAYLRDSKITKANDTAQQIYMSAQDYLVSAQIKGTKSSYYSTDTVCYIGGTKTPGVAPVVSTDTDITTVRTTVNAGETKSPAQTVADEIFGNPSAGKVSMISEDFEGAWVIAFYPKTFTVKYVVFTAEPDSTDPTAFNMDAIVDKGGVSGNPYTHVYDATRSQEYDARYSTPYRYTGQYPVPVA